MNLSNETQKSVKKLVRNWERVRAYFSQLPKKEDWLNDRESVIGHLWWDNPDLVWVLITDKEESYEGSQAQIGITKDGRIMWEYQSHCSCNSYEDSTGEGNGEFLPELSKKSYELNGIPYDWEHQIRENITKLLGPAK